MGHPTRNPKKPHVNKAITTSGDEDGDGGEEKGDEGPGIQALLREDLFKPR